MDPSCLSQGLADRAAAGWRPPASSWRTEEKLTSQPPWGGFFCTIGVTKAEQGTQNPWGSPQACPEWLCSPAPRCRACPWRPEAWAALPPRTRLLPPMLQQ